MANQQQALKTYIAPTRTNIVARGDPPDQVRTELEIQLRQLRRQYGGDIQIIWRSV